jgi:DNA-directed RNA polymerase subunit M/transcription elongation factor TFIIS
MTLQRKRPVQRAHTGLVGMSYELESVAPGPASPAEPPDEPTTISPKKRGRPRKHPNDAAKQKAYLKRKTQEEIVETARKVIGKNKDTKGRLPNETSGGYDSKKIDIVEGMTEGQEATTGGGRRVKPEGIGPTLFDVSFADFLVGTKPNTREAKDSRSQAKSRARKNANWDFDAGYRDWLRNQIIESLVRDHFQSGRAMYECKFLIESLVERTDTGATFISAPCDFHTDAFNDAVSHLSVHGSIERVLEQTLREEKQSRRGFKKSKCPESVHIYRTEQRRLAGEKQKVYCGDCKKLIYTPPDPGIS